MALVEQFSAALEGHKGSAVMSNSRTPLENLPAFASDAEIGKALLGPDRACEWRGIAEILEGRGLPPVDDLMGGRYTPAVRAYFDKEYGLASIAPAAPDGEERPEAWAPKKTSARRA